jgi:hypothetical protein
VIVSCCSTTVGMPAPAPISGTEARSRYWLDVADTPDTILDPESDPPRLGESARGVEDAMTGDTAPGEPVLSLLTWETLEPTDVCEVWLTLDGEAIRPGRRLLLVGRYCMPVADNSCT